jgi:hypothetical protein
VVRFFVLLARLGGALALSTPFLFASTRFRFVDWGVARSGNFRLPVSRFHSSKVSGEIFPSTRS